MRTSRPGYNLMWIALTAAVVAAAIGWRLRSGANGQGLPAARAARAPTSAEAPAEAGAPAQSVPADGPQPDPRAATRQRTREREAR